MVLLYAALVTKFAVVIGGEGIQVGKVVAVFIHVRQSFFKALADTAHPAVLGQGGYTADTAHLAGMTVKPDLIVGNGEGTHHIHGIVGECGPMVDPVVSGVCGAVGQGHFECDIK